MRRVTAVNANPFAVVPATGSLREAAAARIAGRGSGRSPAAGREFLSAAARHGIDIRNMWASVAGDGCGSPTDRVARQAALSVPAPGGASMVFTSTPADAGEAAELAEVVRACCESGGARLAQALLEPGDTGIAAALERAGFRRLASLAYLRASLPAKDSLPPSAPDPALPSGVEARHWREGDDGDLIVALRRSYIDTLDCPELCELRSVEDTLESHRATGGAGAFDPRFWWILRERGAPEGALLFNRCSDQGHVELVYLGLSPTLRGRGIGGAILRHGLTALAREPRPERLVCCAVDHRNTPAKRLYSGLGFREFATREAFVRRLSPPLSPPTDR